MFLTSTLKVTGAVVLVVLTGAGLMGSILPGHAQSDDCEQLRRQIASLNRPDPSRDARFARAVQQQRAELARTQAYSDQIGCGSGFSLFGGSTPPQCDSISDRIVQMQGNLDALNAQARASRNGDPDRETDLNARYDAYCRRTAPGQDYPTDGYTDPGVTPDGSASIMDDRSSQDETPQGGGKAICVRTCDGGFFPLGSSVRTSQLDDLQALCSAQCPNTEAKLYTTNNLDSIADAVAADGTAYSEMPAAFKFEKTFEASCTCKPPNQTWVQALARAEQLLDRSQTNDVTVTEKMSADMARPSAFATQAQKKASRRDKKAQADAQQSPPGSLASATGALGAVGAQAPTASNASAGIALGAGAPTPVVRSSEGEIRAVRRPDGVTRNVRIIAPAP